MHRHQTALVELFQLLIGNTDYSTIAGPAGDTCCHNTRLFVGKGSKDANSDIIPIPYDFDMSGFVDAPYAAPTAQFPIYNVRERYFIGWCKEERHFLSAIEHFKERKAAVYASVRDSGLLKASTLNGTLRYLDKFYAKINNESRVAREITGRCRGSMVEG